MQNTCYVHSQTSDAGEVAFVMRSERFIPDWNRNLRDVVGEDNVRQLKVCGGKTGWAIPWRWIHEAVALLKYYFTDILPERESLLGNQPFTEEQTIEVGAMLEAEEPKAKPASRPSGQTELWTNAVEGEFYVVPMKVEEVGNDQAGAPRAILKGASGKMRVQVNAEEAKALGSRLYDWVMVTVREAKDGEIPRGD